MDIKSNAIHHYFEAFAPRAEAPKFTMLVFKLMLNVNLWMETSRSRKHLSKLSDEQLKDIGVCRADAEREACRKFYDI